MKGLTQRQIEITKFIENYIEDHGFPPSIRDIGNNFGFSPKAAYDHLSALRKKGIIKSDENIPRAMVVLKSMNDKSDTLQCKIPILGTTAAGSPILSEEAYDGYISVSQNLVGRNNPEDMYVLKVNGDSMIDDGINDGDLAVMVRTKCANNGDIVAASIGDEQNYGITLKHFYHKDDRYELRPANRAYESMFSANCEIHGRLVLIIRKVS